MRAVPKRLVPLLCPVLLAAFPVLSLFAQNQSEVELSVLRWPLVLSVAAAVVVFGVLLLVTRNAAKSGVMASLLVVAFFYYWLFPDQRAWWSLVLWLVLLVVGLVVLVRSRRDLGALTVVLAIGAAVMTVPSAVSIVRYHANHPSLSAVDPRLWPSALAAPVVASGVPRPDIYLIIPDDYARVDVLKQYFDYDDSAFVRRLQQRGFVLSAHTRSPYSDSESNVAALLNMDYLTRFPSVLGESSLDVRPVKRVSQDNRAAGLLTAVGYRYVHLDTDEVTFAGGNPGISALAPPDSFANLWLRKSILQRVGGPLGFSDRATNDRFRKSVHSVFSELAAQRPDSRPTFTVFHTLIPHDPYVFSADGRAVTFPGHADADLSSDSGRAYYVHQLEYLNSQLLHTVDQILARAKTPPVIVIQSDEGFSADPEVFGEAAMKDIRVKGLGAFYLPGHRAAGVPEPPNMVNTMRFVLNLYLGTHYAMLESQSHPEGDLPYDYSEELTVK